jgi:hypothetical protein
MRTASKTCLYTFVQAFPFLGPVGLIVSKVAKAAQAAKYNMEAAEGIKDTVMEVRNCVDLCAFVCMYVYAHVCIAKATDGRTQHGH